jgi:hypothetical protein
MLRPPLIETMIDLSIRVAECRGRDERFVDDARRMAGIDALVLAFAGATSICSKRLNNPANLRSPP